MEAVVLIGLQASGKSSFCRDRLYNSHVRINLDMLRTRLREKLLIAACHEAKQPYVVDNTNPSRADRVGYIQAAKLAGFRIIGYYFASKVEECKTRNSLRPDEQAVPLKGLLGTYGKLELPERDEGFDELHYVSITADGDFSVSEWTDEV
jgi:predicted kinase